MYLVHRCAHWAAEGSSLLFAANLKRSRNFMLSRKGPKTSSYHEKFFKKDQKSYLIGGSGFPINKFIASLNISVVARSFGTPPEEFRIPLANSPHSNSKKRKNILKRILKNILASTQLTTRLKDFWMVVPRDHTRMHVKRGGSNAHDKQRGRLSFVKKLRVAPLFSNLGMLSGIENAGGPR